MPADKSLLIAIDVGNSRIKVGLFENTTDYAAQGKLPPYIHSLAVEVDEAIPWAEIHRWRDTAGGTVRRVVLGGVNPRGRDKVLDGWPATGWPAPMIVDNPFVLPINIRVKSPRTVGVDRLFNAIAGNIIRPEGTAMILVDSGTATTVDVVGSDGAFEGGAILPGFQLGSRALHLYTALLPRIRNDELENNPAPLGKNTREALRSGLFWGQLGAIRELISQLKQDLPGEPYVVVTGGAGRLIFPHLSNHVLHEPFLALQGLVLVGHELQNS